MEQEAGEEKAGRNDRMGRMVRALRPARVTTTRRTHFIARLFFRRTAGA